MDLMGKGFYAAYTYAIISWKQSLKKSLSLTFNLFFLHNRDIWQQRAG